MRILPAQEHSYSTHNNVLSLLALSIYSSVKVYVSLKFFHTYRSSLFFIILEPKLKLIAGDLIRIFLKLAVNKKYGAHFYMLGIKIK